MGQIRGTLHASLQSGNDMIVPGTVIETDLANGSVSLEKLQNKNFIYTVNVPILHPLWYNYECVQTTPPNVGWASGWGSFLNTDDINCFSVPMNSYLVRVDFSITNPMDIPTTSQITFNFSDGARNTSPAAPYKLTQGLIVRGGVSTPNNHIVFDDTQFYYTAGATIFLHLTEVHNNVKNMNALFTFKANILA